MSVRTRSLASLALATLLLACPSPAPPPAAAADAGAGSADAGSASEDGGADSSVWIRVFHTGDEHGWLAPYEDSASATRAGGVAELLATWRAEQGFDPERDLLLSSGDNWAGAAISSWFDGEPAAARRVGDTPRARLGPARFLTWRSHPSTSDRFTLEPCAWCAPRA